MLKRTRNPYGYKNLLVYKKADALMEDIAVLTGTFLRQKPFFDLADQITRSGRSTKQNVVEGWKRNSTREYYNFLGFAIASNAEVEEDCNDIISGKYPKLLEGSDKIYTLDEVEELPFYPLDETLPVVVRVKLRTKELNFLLDRLQQSLVTKMEEDRTLSAHERLERQEQEARKAGEWYKDMLKEHDLVRLENGRVVKSAKSR